MKNAILYFSYFANSPKNFKETNGQQISAKIKKLKKMLRADIKNCGGDLKTQAAKQEHKPRSRSLVFNA